MPLAGFEALLNNHPGRANELRQLEAVIQTVMTGDRNAVIDEQFLGSRTPIPKAELEELLVELTNAGLLEPRAFWMCPTMPGVTAEAAAVANFDESVECAVCGQRHRFAAGQVEIRFVASRALRHYLATTGR